MEQLIPHLKRIRRRHRLFDGWEMQWKGLWLAISSGIVILILGRFLPIENLPAWSSFCLVAWIIGAWLYTSLRPVSLLRTASRTDIDLHLYERLSTCLVLPKQAGLFPSELVSAQQLDALSAARHANLPAAYPLRFHRRSLVNSAIAAIVWIAMLVLPNPMDTILAARREIREEAVQQARQVEELNRQVSEAAELDPEKRQEIQRLLEELAEKLRSNPGDLDQALADLSEAERELGASLNPEAALLAVNLNSLADQLSSVAGEELQTEEDPALQAQAALDELLENLDKMSEAERNQLSASLSQMAAQATQAGDARLSEALSALSQDIQSGDRQSIDAGSQRAAAAFSQSQRKLEAQTRLQQLLSSLQSSRQALAASGQSTAQGSPSQGNQGQPGGGGGTNAQVLPPGTGQGQASAPLGNRPLGGEDDLESQGTTPRETGNFIGDELFIPGIDSGQGPIQVLPGENQAPGSPNPALIPYNQAYYSYLNAAMQSLSQDYIPANLLDYVQQYFLLLEPQ